MKFLISTRDLFFKAFIDNLSDIRSINFFGSSAEFMKNWIPEKILKKIKKSKAKRKGIMDVTIIDDVYINSSETKLFSTDTNRMLNIVISNPTSLSSKEINKLAVKFQESDIILRVSKIPDIYILIEYAIRKLKAQEINTVLLLLDSPFLYATEVTGVALDTLNDIKKLNEIEEFLLSELYASSSLGNQTRGIALISDGFISNNLLEEYLTTLMLNYDLFILKKIKPIPSKLSEIASQNTYDICYILSYWTPLYDKLKMCKNIYPIQFASDLEKIPISIDVYSALRNVFGREKLLGS